MKIFLNLTIDTRTTVKYINKTLDAIKSRSASSSASEDEHSILEDLLIRGMSPKDAMVMVVDMLLAGIDTVFNYLFR